ncbi:ParM/StbA family protein [Radiobacillus sp. PE A8.2]|uniref:ParM/StbA family protein n=1 Tax=Radiobacillus sp. PE A8.2 TaxID=3380349 RepID=UPI00388D58E9
MLHGVDGGNNGIKIVNYNGAHKVDSSLGEWRERKLVSSFGKDDLEIQYKGKRYFGGTLAKYESEFRRSIMGDSKSHEDAKLRILIGLHLFSSDMTNDIVVGQPIIKHNDTEKNKIKEMLKGWHHLVINDVEKEIFIDRVEVAPEGGAIFFAIDSEDELVRVIDFGGGTVHTATILGGNFIDKDSNTLLFGADTNKSNDIESMVNAVIAKTSEKWDRNDKVLVGGGIANEAISFLEAYFTNIEVVKPKLITRNGIQKIHPVYANATGFYNLARMIYGG